MAFRKKSSDAKLRNYNLFLDFKVRWNTLYLMLERFYKFKFIINSITLDPSEIPNITLKQKKNIENLRIYSNDWELIESLVCVLKPFYEATLRLQKTTCTMFGLSKIIEKVLLKWCTKQIATSTNRNIKILTKILYEHLNKHLVDKISASQKIDCLVLNLKTYEFIFF